LVDYNLYKNQRVGVFVDVQNFYYSAKSAYNCKVNFAQILKDAVRGRILIRALAYVIKADVGAEKTFFDALDLMGYEVQAKEIQIFYGGAKKGDWDVGITMDCIALATKLDVVIICSGDGDFIPLVDYLQKSAGCRVEVMAFGKSASSKLKHAADKFFDLGSNRYLIPYGEKRARVADDRPRAYPREPVKRAPLPAKPTRVVEKKPAAPPDLAKTKKKTVSKKTTRKKSGRNISKTKTS